MAETSSTLNSNVVKKELGAFYTPSEASKILCEWAIRSHNDILLEPSFGGCEFLEQAKLRLEFFGAKKPHRFLFGSDIDESAFVHLQHKLGIRRENGNFKNADFMTLRPSDFTSHRFNTVIGNPPYISHHNMSETQKSDARKAMKEAGFSLPGKASLWAYFVLHSLSFLGRGGRMAWILPGSFLFADYSTYVRQQIERWFKRSIALYLRERIFLPNGSEESTVVVLCDEYLETDSPSNMQFGSADELDELRHMISQWQAGKWHGECILDRTQILLTDAPSRTNYGTLAMNKNAYELGTFNDILIGIVTGSNSFFIINQSKADEFGLTEPMLKPILPKMHISCGGLQLKAQDLANARNADLRCLLIDTSQMKEGDPVFKYLETYPNEMRGKNRTFQKRSIWHQPDDGRVPDAFFPYMQNIGPRLLLNDAAVTSSNTIHRVFFKPEIKKYEQRLIAISLLTTFSQLSAEIEGRSYGSGVLKHEPSEVKRIKILIPDNVDKKEITEAFNSIDKTLRKGDLSKAQRQANDFIFSRIEEGLSGEFIAELTKALCNSRYRRRGRKNNVAR